MGSEFRNSNGKSEIIKGKGVSIGNEGFELLSLAEFSERRWLLKIRAWSVVLELISKKGMVCLFVCLLQAMFGCFCTFPGLLQAMFG